MNELHQVSSMMLAAAEEWMDGWTSDMTDHCSAHLQPLAAANRQYIARVGMLQSTMLRCPSGSDCELHGLLTVCVQYHLPQSPRILAHTSQTACCGCCVVASSKPLFFLKCFQFEMVLSGFII